MTMCPLCGASVTYQGLSAIECVGPGCVNGPVFKAPVWRDEFSEAWRLARMMLPATPRGYRPWYYDGMKFNADSRFLKIVTYDLTGFTLASGRWTHAAAITLWYQSDPNASPVYGSMTIKGMKVVKGDNDHTGVGVMRPSTLHLYVVHNTAVSDLPNEYWEEP